MSIPRAAQATPVLVMIQRWAGPIAIAVGCSAILGWLAGIPVLTSILPGATSMKANTAIALILLGIARLARSPGFSVDGRAGTVRHWIGILALAGAAAVAALTLGEWLTGVDLRIDELIARDRTAGTDPPGRPAPGTAVAVLLIGAAIAATARAGRLARVVADACAVATFLLALVALLGILYGAVEISGQGALLRLAISTVVVVALLATAVLVDGVPEGAAGVFARPTVDGLFARRLGLGIIVILPLVGLVRRAGDAGGFLDGPSGVAVMVVGGGAVIAAYGAWAARRLVQSEELAAAADARVSWLIRHFPNGAILAFDRTLRYTLAGGTGFDRLAARPEAVIGTTRIDELPDEVEPLRRAALRGDEGTIESWVGGRLFRLVVTPLRGPRDEVMGGLVVGLDVTEERLREQQLRTLNTDLEEYAAVVSHDLRAPLRRIQLFADHVLKLDAGRLRPESRDALERIDVASGRLQRLVVDLLEYARVGRQAMTIRPVDLRAELDGALRELAAELGASGATVEVGALPVVEGDAAQLRQLFLNLLDNAMKFRDPTRELRIAIQAQALPAADVWVLEIRDTGRGFAPERRGEIFGLFRRLGTGSERDGTGLGLAICRRVVERHGGSIEAEGVPGEGATFRIVLPERQPRREVRRSGASHADAPGVAGPRDEPGGEIAPEEAIVSS